MSTDLAEYNSAIRQHPDDYRLYAQRADALLQAGRTVEALADRQRAVQLHPADPWLWTDLAGLRYAMGDFEAAAGDHDKAVALRPQEAVFYCNRGMARAACGDADGAFADLDKAVELKPEDPDARYLRGSLLRQTGRPEDALADLEAAIAARPDDPLICEERALTRSALGQTVAAQSDWETALDLAPAADRACRFGQWYVEQGQLALALDCFDHALALDGGYAPALATRGALRRTTGDTANALQDYEQAVRADPDNAGFWTACAELYIAGNAWAKACDAAGRALALAPEHLPAYRCRIVAERNLDQARSAWADLRKYLERATEPEDRTWAEQQLRKLDAGEKLSGLFGRLIGR
jgi:tetratricopeptide (TPR) repeat protein